MGLAVAAFGLGAGHLQTHAVSLPTPAIAPADASASWLSPTIAAGTTWRGAVVVTNTATVAQCLRLYADDAAIVDGGALAPAASRRVGAAIRVPAATKPGVHLAALVAQGAVGRPPSAGVRVVDRGALRVSVTVTAACARPRPATVGSTRRGPHAARALLRALGFTDAPAVPRSSL